VSIQQRTAIVAPADAPVEVGDDAEWEPGSAQVSQRRRGV
jgi:hypothetical protein